AGTDSTGGHGATLNNNQNSQLLLKITTSFKTSSSNIISIPTPSVHQVQQEQDHLLHLPIAVSPPPIIPSNIELPPIVNTQPNNITQPVNNMLVSQQQAQNQQQLVNQQQQLFGLQNQQFTSQPNRLPDPPNSWTSIAIQPVGMYFRSEQDAQRLHNEMILQENRARKEYRTYMQQRALNKAQRYLMDGMFMNLEARSKGFYCLSYHPFGNFQPSFNPNQYIDNLSQISSQDQQEYSNDLDQYQIQIDDDHDSNDDVFGDADLIELQVRGRRGRGKKNRGRGVVKAFAPSLQIHQHSIHQPCSPEVSSNHEVSGLLVMLQDLNLVVRQLYSTRSREDLEVELDCPEVCQLLEVVQYLQDQLEEQTQQQESEEDDLGLIVLNAHLELEQVNPQQFEQEFVVLIVVQELGVYLTSKSREFLLIEELDPQFVFEQGLEQLCSKKLPELIPLEAMG
ncbi:MAG: hypothetical protein EZS28_041441, partial [Streblomastix strix]